jgi:pyruvate ferredoxin oxidoreductase beta subunit
MLSRAAVESGTFPVFEAEHGQITASTKIRRRIPVEDYLRPQKRYAHLFGPNGRPDIVEKLQRIADNNITKYNLIAEGEEQ